MNNKLHRLILVVLSVMSISGCISLFNDPVYTFESGRYWVRYDIQKPDSDTVYLDCIIENENGNIIIIDPADGDTVMSALIQENLFLATPSTHGSGWIFRGKLTKKNHIEGDLKGRVRKPFLNSKKFKVLMGKFTIFPSKDISPRDRMSFLPVVDYGLISRKDDPRVISIMVDKNGTVYYPEIVRADYSPSEWIAGKKTLPQKQLKKVFNTAAEKYGNDTPVIIYADKSATISSCANLFDTCNEIGLYQLKFNALQPKWEALFLFSLELLDKTGNGYQNKEKVVPVRMLKEQILVRGKAFPKEKFEAYFKEVGENDPDQSIVLEYSEDATFQKLLCVLSVFHKYSLKRVSLSPKAFAGVSGNKQD